MRIFAALFIVFMGFASAAIGRTGILTNIYNVEDYGAIADFKQIGDGAMTAGQNTFSSPSGPFLSTDVGKLLLVAGAGNQGVNSLVLLSKIDSYVSATQVILHHPAMHTVTGTEFQYATDSTSAIQDALNAAKLTGGDVKFLSAGMYGVTHLNAADPTRAFRMIGIGAIWWGTRLVPMADGAVVLDCAGHDAFGMKNLAIGGSNSQLALPDIGLLMAPTTFAPGMDVPVFEKTTLDGFFRTTSAYFDRIYGGTMRNAGWGNYYQGGSPGVTYTVIFTGRNVYNVTSAFATITSSTGANLGWKIERTEFHNMNPNPAGGALANTIYLDGLRDSVFESGIIAGSYIAPIVFGPGCVGNTFIGVEFSYDMNNGYSYVFYGASADQTALININPAYHSALHANPMTNLTIIGRQ